jgi:hypothetical protein
VCPTLSSELVHNNCPNLMACVCINAAVVRAFRPNPQLALASGPNSVREKCSDVHVQGL